MDPVVTTEALSKTYQLGKTKITALADINLQVNRGEFLSIAGPSGSGKSTLLNLMGCLDTPTGGKIEISGQDTALMSPNDLADTRNNKIGFIFQTFNLIPVLTAWENIEFPLIIGNVAPQKRKLKIREVLSEVGIAAQAHQRPEELSGGQRQRVAIARALVKSPQIILADEPTANLDSKTGEHIIKLMLTLNREKGTTFIFSTHDRMVMNHASRIIRLRDGRTEG